ncbi:C40 family peptidase [Actinotalea solisilvae]|uniref:C40 family peptidase n=1 Tax=Actinotalea solisilvae TaxID=2072922 RepID=UPI0018F1F18F|nr:C40 family peptidase [Actinotalea solisilvae]
MRTWGAGARRAAAATTLVLLLGTATAGASWADPDVSTDDVAAAQDAVRTAARDVASLEVALATQSAALETAWTDVAAAAEDYTEAVGARDAATARSEEAAAQAAAAAEDAEVARDELGQIALQAYRSGGTLDGLGAFLSADGFEDLVARRTAMDQLGSQAQRAVQRFDAADLVARTLQTRADEAAARAEAAAQAAEDALATAQQLYATAEEQVAAIAAEREVLLSELAALRQTSLEVERARQAQVDAERAARAEAAAAAQRGVTPSPPSATPPPTPSAATPPVTAPPVVAPPVSAPPVTAPPVVAPPVTAPPVTAPPVTPPPVVAPPVTAPPVVTPPPASDPYGLGTGSQRGTAAQGQSAVAWAVSQVGKAYGWGAAGPEAFDCSGLTSKAWAAAGLSIHRTSRDQYRQVQKISYDSMRPGDLIFYGSVGSDPGSITHVAMFVGNGQMVEAPRPGVAVRVTAIRWSGTMPYAGRP